METLIAPVEQARKSPQVGEALSGVFGSVSLTAWICLLLPQLITNYKNQNADGLSILFLLIWVLGDASNLAGACFTKLSPSAIALASYFCFADLVLISQCTYYNTINARRRARHAARGRRVSAAAPQDSEANAVVDPEATEDEPLLGGDRRHRRRSGSIGLPGSHRRNSLRRRESTLDPLTRVITGEDETPDSNPWLHNTVSVVAVWIVGAGGWFVSYKMGAWNVGDSAPDAGDELDAAEPVAIIGMVLGYFSALCYLCARIPQIIKNYREKSCEGLALLFFLLSLTGNFTYGASVISYSQEKDYFIRALPWLLGSLGTIVEDMIIFLQFRLYSPKRQAKTTGNA